MKDVVRAISVFSVFLSLGFGLVTRASGAATVYVVGPTTWATFADGGGGPIDGVVDFSEIRGRVIAGYSSTTPEVFRGIYEFDLSGANSANVTARLILQVTGSFGLATLPMRLFGYAGDGIATAADSSSGVLLTSFNIGDVGQLEIDVTSFIATLMAGGHRYAGFGLSPAGNPFTDSTAFILGDPTQPPSSLLSVALVPEPSGGVLGVMFLLGCAWIKRRKPAGRSSWNETTGRR